MSRRKKSSNAGFSLIEVMIALMVLTIGLVGTAALMSTTLSSTVKSHTMSTAALLASEKLEDLGRFGKNDSPVQPGGSLVANTAAITTAFRFQSTTARSTKRRPPAARALHTCSHQRMAWWSPRTQHCRRLAPIRRPIRVAG